MVLTKSPGSLSVITPPQEKFTVPDTTTLPRFRQCPAVFAEPRRVNVLCFSHEFCGDKLAFLKNEYIKRQKKQVQRKDDEHMLNRHGLVFLPSLGAPALNSL